MIYTESELKKKIYKMIEEFESEVVEFKEATSNYSFNDIDKVCEIVRNIANEYFGDWEQSCKVEDTFRKAMEE